ncbi:hypothetical protein ACIHCQ_32550 [Streptomyces sp. NPDC052236]
MKPHPRVAREVRKVRKVRKVQWTGGADCGVTGGEGRDEPV